MQEVPGNYNAKIRAGWCTVVVPKGYAWGRGGTLYGGHVISPVDSIPSEFPLPVLISGEEETTFLAHC